MWTPVNRIISRHKGLHFYPIASSLFLAIGAAAASASKPATTVPEDRDILPMDCTGFNPYHNPNEVRRFNIQRTQLLIDEVELGSGNFGCVKKGVLKAESWADMTKQKQYKSCIFTVCALLSVASRCLFKGQTFIHKVCFLSGARSTWPSRCWRVTTRSWWRRRWWGRQRSCTSWVTPSSSACWVCATPRTWCWSWRWRLLALSTNSSPAISEFSW